MGGWGGSKMRVGGVLWGVLEHGSKMRVSGCGLQPCKAPILKDMTRAGPGVLYPHGPTERENSREPGA